LNKNTRESNCEQGDKLKFTRIHSGTNFDAAASFDAIQGFYCLENAFNTALVEPDYIEITVQSRENALHDGLR